MLNIINPGYKRILKLFYENKDKYFHLREIARKTKLNENSAYRFLNKLEKEHILESQKEANLKKFRLENNNKTYSVLSLFDMERFDSLPSIRKNAIYHYLEQLQERPIFAIVFGSTAKNTYTEESDIDILIITNKKIDTKKAEKEADSLTALSISTFQTTYNEFLKELKIKQDKVIQSALTSGYPILNHVQYYKVLNDERV